MSSRRLVCVPLLVLVAGAFAQPTNVWVKRANFTSSSRDRILATQKVGPDSMVVASVRWGTADLDPWGGFLTLTRHDGSGAVVWTRDYVLPGGGSPAAAHLSANSTGDLVVALRTSLSTGEEAPDMVVHKFRGVDGAPMWTRQFAEAQMNGEIVGAAFDPSNNVLIGGQTLTGSSRSFRVIKLNGANSAVLWQTTGTVLDLVRLNPRAMAVDGQGNVALVGSGATSPSACVYDNKAVTMRFSGATGVKTWERLFTLEGTSDNAVDCAFDSTNALVVAFDSRDANNKVNPTLVKYAGATGNPAWTRTIPLVGTDVWTVDNLEIGPGNTIFMSGEWLSVSNDGSVYVGKWAPNGGQQFVRTFPEAQNKNHTTQPGGLRVDAAGNPVVAMIETTGNQQTLPVLYFAKMNGTTGNQIWYRRTGVTGFTSPVIRNFQVYANGALNAGVSHKGRSALLRYANTIPAQPTWVVQPTPATVGRDDTAGHFVQNGAGEIFVAGLSNGSLLLSKYNSAGTRVYGISHGPVTYQRRVRQVALANDGNILVATEVNDGTIAKFNASTGAKMWELGTLLFANSNEPYVMQASTDGIFVLSNTGRGVVKLDENGTFVWGSNSNLSTGSLMCLAPDGNPVFAGIDYPSSFPCGQPHDYRVIAAKFDKTTGATLWTYTSTRSVVSGQALRGLRAAPDGSIFLASIAHGTTPVTSQSSVIKLNSAGVEQFDSLYAPTGHGSTTSLAMALDGNNPILVQTAVPATNVGSDVVVVRYNGATGAQTYATKDTGNNTTKIRPNHLFANGTGAYVFGWRVGPTLNREAVMFKLNAAGARQWTYAYAGTPNGANSMSWAAPAISGTNLVWVGSGTGTNSGYDQVVGRITNP